MDDNDIKSYVEDEVGIKVVGIESNRRNSFNQSYRIDISYSEKNRALDSLTWYQGLIIKPFKKKPKNQSYHPTNNDRSNGYIDEYRNGHKPNYGNSYRDRNFHYNERNNFNENRYDNFDNDYYNMNNGSKF